MLTNINAGSRGCTAPRDGRIHAPVSGLVGMVVAVLAMMVRFPGALPGPDVVSASDHLTVHPLFQDGDERGRVVHPHLSDPALQFAALDRQTVQALRAGRAPLWNPDLYGGAPLLGDGQSRPFSPVTLLRALLPDAPGLAQDLGVAWLFAWLSVGIALLTRRVLDSGVWVTATACAAAHHPHLSVWLLHAHVHLCLAALVSAGLDCSSLPLMAAATAGVCMGGHPGTLAHIAGISAVWWLLRSREWRPVVGALTGFLLAAPAWMPVWEQVQRSTTRTARVGGTLEPTLLLDLVWPGWWGHPVTETWSGSGAWADGQLHPGLAAVLLGILGLLAMRSAGHRTLVVGLLAGMLLATVASVTGLPGPRPWSARRWWPSGGTSVQSAHKPASTVAQVRGASPPVLAPALPPAGTSSTPCRVQHAPHRRLGLRLRTHVEDGRILGVGWAAQPTPGRWSVCETSGATICPSRPTPTA